MNLNNMLDSKEFLFAMPAIAALILLVNFLIRVLNIGLVLPGELPYLHLLSAQSPNTPYDFLIAPTNVLGPLYAFFVSLLLIAVTTGLFIIFLRQLDFSPKMIGLTLFVLLLTPAFLATFYFLTPLALTLFLTLLAIVTFQRRYFLFVISFSSLLLLSVVGFPEFLFALAIIIAMSLRKTMHRIITLSFFSIFFFFLFAISLVLGSQHPFLHVISDLGSLFGFGIFHIMLAGVGLLLSWRLRVRSLTAIYVWLLASLVLVMLFGLENIALVMLPVSLLAAITIYYLVTTKWTLQIGKILTIVLITSGLLFSYLSYSSRVIEIEPTLEQHDTLLLLTSYPDGKVLSHQSNGHWIEYFSTHDPVIDSQSSPELVSEVDDVFQLRNIPEATQKFSDLQVRYLWIDSAMIGEVWSKDDDGLLFLLRNNETFSPIYTSENVQVWEILTFTE